MNKFKSILILIVIISVSQFSSGCIEQSQTDKKKSQIEKPKIQPVEPEQLINSELKETYELLLANYNERIAVKRSNLKTLASKINDYQVMVSSQFTSPKDIPYWEKQLNNALKDYFNKLEMAQEVVEKRLLFKIKILEEYDFLPNWWKEEEFIIPKEIKM